MMSKEWSRFVTALEAKGITFDQVQYASDHQTVIRAAGFTDPLSIAIVETEWQKRVGPVATTAAALQGSAGTSSSSALGPATAAASAEHSGSVALASLVQDYKQLQSLPEEMQDSIVAAEVLNAALGFPGALLQVTTAGVGNFSSSSSGGGAGVPGSVVEGFTVSSLVPPSMRSLCQTVLPVADAFLLLRRVEQAEYLSRSLVTMALGETISEICTSYAHQITKLQRWSQDKATPLMGVVSEILRVGHLLVRLRQVLPVDLLLSSTASVGNAIAAGASSSASGVSAGDTLLASSSSHLSGPRVLNHLCEQAEKYAGSREDHDMLLLLLRRSVVPYLRMLHRWMHEGIVEDPFGEFFITEAYDGLGLSAGTSGMGSGGGGTSGLLGRGTPAGISGGSVAAAAAAAAQRRTLSRLFQDETGGYGGGVLGAAAAGGADRFYTPFSAQDAGQLEVIAFERRFSLNKLMIPSFLERPSRIAKMIFFAGKYCCLLREYNETLPHFGESAEGMLVWSGVDALHGKVQASFEIASGAVIQLLFSTKVDLMGHLNSLKYYYLQSRGDWVVDFLDNADELLAKSLDKVKIHSLRVLLQAAIARCSSSSDPYHQLIGCSFSDVTLEQHIQRTMTATGTATTTAAGAAGGRVAGGVVEAHRAVELLQLEVDLQWPVTLVLDGPVLRRFNAIFRLLMSIKVCERKLCALWHANDVLAGFSAAYGIKHQLIQFLRQFQFYAAHFVVEPMWGRLMQRISQSDSVFTINQSLQEFFESVESGLVLSNTHRFRSLTKILELTMRFCEIGRHSSTATLPLIEATLHSVEDELLDALSELASPVGADYAQLVPLFTWADFNHFYDRNNVFHIQHGGVSYR